MDNFIKYLIKQEDASVINTIAFMSYNPSIGRVLEKGGLLKFHKIIHEMVGRLQGITNKNGYDELHHEYVYKIISRIKNNQNERISYGQAQKPINVFMKVYVDWAKKPNAEIRKKLLPFLHVPLDSILMKTVKNEYPDWYGESIQCKISDSQRVFSLSGINKNLYYRWQSFFRHKYSSKPLIFDIAWSVNRKVPK